MSSLIARAPGFWPLLRPLTHRFWDRRAKRWDERLEPDRQDHLAPLLTACDELVSEPRRVLELGTGTGAGAGDPVSDHFFLGSAQRVVVTSPGRHGETLASYPLVRTADGAVPPPSFRPLICSNGSTGEPCSVATQREPAGPVVWPRVALPGWGE